MPDDHQQQLGERLRSIRNQQSLTLQDVEDASGGRWKAVVVGSYERGDRGISVAKLAELAAFYGVPVRDLLPKPATTERDVADDRVVLDLTRIGEDEAHDGVIGAVSRYARRIQLQRGDYNGRVLSLRADDLTTLATAYGQTAEDLMELLADEDALLPR